MRVALDALCDWSRRRERPLIIGTVATGAALRALLVVYSPVPFGYVWDPYHAGVAILFSTGRLPVADDCWACFHPPLYYLLGWPFYAAGRWLHPENDEVALRLLGGLAIVAAAITIYYGQRLLRLFRCRGASLVLGLALLVLFPCLFISSYAPEADIVLTAVLTAFLYYLVKYCAQPSRMRPLDVVRIGALAGCAAATKYSGLLAPLTIVIVMGLQVIGVPLARRTTSSRAMKHAITMLLIAGVVGGWKYVDNARRYGTALHANGSASEGFTIGGSRVRGAEYEFTTLRLSALRRLFGPRAPEGELTTFPVYFSVWTTLHALGWSDMSFFSVPSRHGDPSHPYPRKSIPLDLAMTVIVLGLVPELLAALGFALTLRHRSTWPIGIFVMLGVASYVWWFLPQQLWALKTKYILFVLPAGVLYALAGLGWLRRRQPVVWTIAAILLVALIVVTNIYLYAFAVGRF
jgi:hypothetical protein